MQTTIDAWESRSRRFGWPALVAAIAAHLLGIFFLDGLTRQALRDRSSVKPLVLRFVPTPAQPAASPPTTVPQQAGKTRRERRNSETAARQSSQPPFKEDSGTPVTREESELLPAAPITSEDSITRFKRDAANIDRDLRSRAPRLLDAPGNTVQTRLEKVLRSAGTSSSTIMAEKVLPDGRRITKVAAPGGGSYCVMREGAGAADGLDPFNHGGVNKVTNCGNLFD